jgi:hypothetical protein
MKKAQPIPPNRVESVRELIGIARAMLSIRYHLCVKCGGPMVRASDVVKRGEFAQSFLFLCPTEGCDMLLVTPPSVAS